MFFTSVFLIIKEVVKGYLLSKGINLIYLNYFIRLRCQRLTTMDRNMYESDKSIRLVLYKHSQTQVFSPQITLIIIIVIIINVKNDSYCNYALYYLKYANGVGDVITSQQNTHTHYQL